MELTLSIKFLEFRESDGFVHRVHYCFTLVNDKFIYSLGSVDLKEPISLIPYEELSEDLVQSWVMDAIKPERLQEIETSLSNRYEAKLKETYNLGVPWEQESKTEELSE